MAKYKNNTSQKDGFTLIELLVVVAIIGILASVAIPEFQEYKRKAYYARTKSEIMSINTGMTSFYMENGEFPGDSSHNIRSHQFASHTPKISGLSFNFRDPWGSSYFIDGCGDNLPAASCSGSADGPPYGVIIASAGADETFQSTSGTIFPAQSDDVVFYWHIGLLTIGPGA